MNEKKAKTTPFAAHADWQNNACLGWMDNPTQLYITGYVRAAELLVKHAITTRSDLDTLVYPIVFLYRHAIELSLKDLIVFATRLQGKREEPDAKHGLARLWFRFQVLIPKEWANAEVETLKKMERYILAVDSVDPKAEVFRYPTTTARKQKVRSMPRQRHVNLRELRDQMADLFDLLGGAGAAIEYVLDRSDG